MLSAEGAAFALEAGNGPRTQSPLCLLRQPVRGAPAMLSTI
jgi:hypothetical protein